MSVTRFILSRLEEAGLSRKQRLTPSQLGMHPCNRGRYGANQRTVHSLAEDIGEVGWDWSYIRDPLCAEEDPQDHYVHAFNAKMVANSKYLAPVQDMSLLAGSLTNGHTVQLLRAVIGGLPSESRRLAVDGKLSLAHIESRDKEFGRAAKEGWEWTVLDHRVRHLYGDKLFMLLSSSKNISLSRDENEVQILLHVFQEAIAYEGSIDWQAILQRVLLTKPKCVETVPIIIKFVRLYAGGANSNFVSDFVGFHSQYVQNERFVSASFWEAICNLVLKDQNKTEVKAPLLRFALLKTQNSCIDSKVHRGECQFISQGDVSALARKHLKKALEAESLLSAARDLVIKAGSEIEEDHRIRLLGFVDTALIRILLGKQKGSTKEFNSMEEAMCDFHDEYAKLVANPLPNQWERNSALHQIRLK